MGRLGAQQYGFLLTRTTSFNLFPYFSYFCFSHGSNFTPSTSFYFSYIFSYSNYSYKPFCSFFTLFFSNTSYFTYLSSSSSYYFFSSSSSSYFYYLSSSSSSSSYYYFSLHSSSICSMDNCPPNVQPVASFHFLRFPTILKFAQFVNDAPLFVMFNFLSLSRRRFINKNFQFLSCSLRVKKLICYGEPANKRILYGQVAPSALTVSKCDNFDPQKRA